MSGTFSGGKKAAQTILARDPDFYRKIGALGGAKDNTGGFHQDRSRAVLAGSVGGRKSRRGLTFVREKNGFYYYIDKKTGESVKKPVYN